MLEPFSATLGYISSVRVHPAFPFLIAPTLHAARVSVAFQANARKSPAPLSWRANVAGYLIMCWGGGVLTHLLLGLPPPMFYSFGPWINYLTVHFVLTSFFSFFPALLHPPTFDTAFFPLDALIKTNSVVGGVSLLYPSSPTFSQVNLLYVKSPLSHLIIGALTSAGGGTAAGTLSMWTSQWSMNTPPIFRSEAGLWGTMDVWSGSIIAAVYGIAMNHHAFRGFLPALLSYPLISQLVKTIYPRYYDVYTFDTLPFNPVEAKALAGLVFTIFFALRVYNVHWATSTTTPPPATPSNGRKAAGAAAVRRLDEDKL